MKQLPTPIPPTPLEKLLAEKKRLKQLSVQQEEELAADFQYMQENAAGLLLSGVSTLLFPGSRSSKGTGTNAVPAEAAGTKEQTPLGLSDYLSIAGSMVPVAWGIVQPILISWGVKQARRWVAGLFAKRKR